MMSLIGWWVAIHLVSVAIFGMIAYFAEELPWHD